MGIRTAIGAYIALCLLAILTGFALAGLTGCTTWHRSHEPIPRERWVYVVIEDVGRFCSDLVRKPFTVACADWGDGNCTMYLPPNAPSWLVEHEEKHCQGWNHS